MKELLFIATVGLILSCQQGPHPEFEANKAAAMKFMELQGSEADLNAQLEMFHEDALWQPAFHGSPQINKSQIGDYLKGWQDAMDDVTFTAQNYLPGVSPETGMADGSVRTYGKWTGTHTATGKKWEVVSYHTWDFKDGKIIAGGDYLDAGGLLASLMQKEEMEE